MIVVEVKDDNKKNCAECSICLQEIINDKTKTKCGHYFHNKCINRWIVINDICPICRTKIVNPVSIIKCIIGIVALVLSFYLSIIIVYFSTNIFLKDCEKIFYFFDIIITSIISFIYLIIKGILFVGFYVFTFYMAIKCIIFLSLVFTPYINKICDRLVMPLYKMYCFFKFKRD